jgi:hydrogenase/urease accessory protein HupE
MKNNFVRHPSPGPSGHPLPSGEGFARKFSAALMCLAFLACTQSAFAHDARPLSILIAERQAHTYRVDVRMPPSLDSENRPEIEWPVGCVVTSHGIREGLEATEDTMLLKCIASLEGNRIGIRYPLFNPALSTLLRFVPAGDATRTAVLPPDQLEWTVPPSSNWKSVAHDYFMLGVKHIWEGIDHLLFVAGLLMLARTPRRIAVAITGFTIAHSITLSLSALGVVRVPVPPIEAGIALSILFLAREVARPNADSLARRFPLLISSLFGLLHGFGFAAALSEAGLPRKEIVPALLLFNVGVEAGQLVFIAVVLVVVGHSRVRAALHRVEFFGGYALGLPASFWFFQRLQAFWLR